MLARSYDSALSQSGMNVTQLAVLRAIERHSSESLSRVAEDLVMDRTTLYRALTLLEKYGWVELKGGRDNRSKTARLTHTGMKALSRADPAWAAIQSALVRRFGALRWRKLVRDMTFLSECADSLQVKGGRHVL